MVRTNNSGASSGAPLGHPLSDAPLPHGQLLDVGTRSYGEFACSKDTFEWLRSGGMRTINGQPVRLQLMDECQGGYNVLVKAWPE
jgi:hypothetical protein